MLESLLVNVQSGFFFKQNKTDLQIHLYFVGEGDEVKLDSDEETVPDPEPKQNGESNPFGTESNPFDSVDPPKTVEEKTVEEPKPQISVSSHSSATAVKVTAATKPKDDVCSVLLNLLFKMTSSSC